MICSDESTGETKAQHNINCTHTTVTKLIERGNRRDNNNLLEYKKNNKQSQEQSHNQRIDEERSAAARERTCCRNMLQYALHCSSCRSINTLHIVTRELVMRALQITIPAAVFNLPFDRIEREEEEKENVRERPHIDKAASCCCSIHSSSISPTFTWQINITQQRRECSHHVEQQYR